MGTICRNRLRAWGYRQSKHKRTMLGILLLLFIINFTTPFTKYGFYLDEYNLYHRSFGAYLNPLASFIYIVHVTVRIYAIKMRTHSVSGQDTAKALIYFLIFPTVASSIQVLIYGITCAQVGFTMGFLTVFLMNQQIKISRDELTGLNNRREYEAHINSIEKASKTIGVCMIDVNKFKSINDNFGHEEGDRALKMVAKILRKACHKCDSNLFLARYGGDEFVIVSEHFSEKLERQLIERIQAEVENRNRIENLPYKLSLSIGISCGCVHSKQDTKMIFTNADKKMYEDKQRA